MALMEAVCCALVLVYGAAGSLVMNVQPTDITPVVTPSLTINCTFTVGENTTDISTVLSLVLSKADTQSKIPPTPSTPPTAKFVEILSMNVYAPKQVQEHSTTNGTFSGHISSANVSFLALHIENPTELHQGIYRCDVNVMDNTGHPVEITATTEVTSHQIDFNQLVEVVNQLQQKVARNEKQQATMLAALFEKSAIFKGHYYLMSKQQCRNADVAEAICENYGGYLVEIDDAEEHEFIRKFLWNLNGVSKVLTGASVDFETGEWTFRFSRQPMVYAPWWMGAPTNSSSIECGVLDSDAFFRMRTHQCYDLNTDDLGYLCELPVY